MSHSRRFDGAHSLSAFGVEGDIKVEWQVWFVSNKEKFELRSLEPVWAFCAVKEKESPMALEFFWSTEVDISVSDSLTKILKSIDVYFSSAKQMQIAQDELVDIVFIPTVLKAGMFDNYKEIRRIKKAKNLIEYRPRVDFNSFSKADECDRKEIILQRLFELVELVDKLELAEGTKRSVKQFILDCSI